MKNKTPFQCGQEDAFFNLARRPRMIVDGRVIKLVQSQEELVSQYEAGRLDSDEFYGVGKKKLTRRTVVFKEGDGTKRELIDDVLDGKMPSESVVDILTKGTKK
jgi:hypothetical protein